ncbi:MAG: hypothetical protein KatS3mg122_1850 [Caldimonas sp.]|nr:MAG: hypothetical protein KatS3mg122_1850 [Caldimonas sp.]
MVAATLRRGLGLAPLLALSACAGPAGLFPPHVWDLLGGLVVILGLLAVGLWWMSSDQPLSRRGDQRRRRLALEELDRRYAAGDIGREEYLQRKLDLLDTDLR